MKKHYLGKLLLFFVVTLFVMNSVLPMKTHAAQTPGITSGSIVKIRNVYSGKLFNVCVNTTAGVRDANGSNVDQFSDDGTLEEHFKVIYDSSQDAYRFRSMISGGGYNRVVDIKRGGLTPYAGCNIQIWEPTDPVSQYFIITPLGSGKFAIRPKSNTSLALTVVDGSNGTATGTTSTSPGNVYLNTYSSTNTKQQFYFDIVNISDPYASFGWSYIYNNSAYTYISGKFLPTNHNGIDIVSRTGSIYQAPIYTPCAGYINDAGNYGTAGNFVEFRSVDEDPVTTYYFRMGFYHLDSPSPYVGRSGTYLPKGTFIGFTGNSGTEFTHLHYFITKDGTYQSKDNEATHVIDAGRFFPNTSFAWGLE